MHDTPLWIEKYIKQIASLLPIFVSRLQAMSSSIYSDSFELDELAQQLSREANAQEQRLISALIVDRDNLRTKLEQLHSTWGLPTIQHLFEEIILVYTQIRQLNDHVINEVKKARNKRLANLFAF